MACLTGHERIPRAHPTLPGPLAGRPADQAAYEDCVLGIAAEHGGRVLQRARGSGIDGQPLEIQLLDFPSTQCLDAFMTDDRRQALASERERVIAKTEVIHVRLVQQDSAQ